MLYVRCMYVPVLVRAQYFAPTPSISAPFAKKHVKTRLNHKIVRNLHAPRRAAPYLCQKLPRLWSSSSLSVIVSDDGGVAIAALRQSTSTMPPVERKCAAQAATHFRFIRLIRGVDCYTQCCALPGEQKKAAEAAFKLWIN